MHGFPDDSRIYDRVDPLLAPRRVVAVDWLGYGRSDRVEPASLRRRVGNQSELRAVLDSLELGQVGSPTTRRARTPSTLRWARPTGSVKSF